MSAGSFTRDINTGGNPPLSPKYPSVNRTNPGFSEVRIVVM